MHANLQNNNNLMGNNTRKEKYRVRVNDELTAF